MKNKNQRNKELNSQGFRISKDRKRKSDVHVPFDLDSNPDYPWWKSLFWKILLPHKNKFIDRIVDVGCLLMVVVLAGVILLVATWIFNLVQKVVY